MPSPARQKPGNYKPAAPPAEGVLGRIQSMQFEQERFKVLLYGRSGTGKTTLWATFPGPILAIVSSGGVNSGELRSVDTPAYRKKIFTVTLNESGELRDLARHVQTEDTYRTVVLDHVSGFQDMVLKEILGLDEVPVQKSWGLARQEQYGQAVTQCKEAFRALINLPCNVVFIGQERTFGEGNVTDVIAPNVGVALMPSLAGWLNPAVDYIAETFIRPQVKEVVTEIAGESVTMQERVAGKVEYCLRVGPHDVYTTKFRVPRGYTLPEVIVDPTFDKIRLLIKGGSGATEHGAPNLGPSKG